MRITDGALLISFQIVTLTLCVMIVTQKIIQTALTFKNSDKVRPIKIF